MEKLNSRIIKDSKTFVTAIESRSEMLLQEISLREIFVFE